MSENGNAAGFGLGMLVGAVIGAAIGILYAPKPGTERCQFSQ
jgi:gas vesicle protein